MKANGSHPYTRRNKKWLIHVGIQQIIYLIVFIFFLYSIKCELGRRDFSATCRNGCLSVVFFDINFQLYTIVLYRKTLNKIIVSMKEDYEKIKSSPEDAEVVALYAEKGRWVTQLWLVTAGIAFLMFPVKNIVLYMAQFIRQDEFQLIAFYELTYPDIIEENKNNIIIYVVTYACLISYAAYSSTTYISFVPLGPIFMLHACGQLELIKKRINKLFDGALSIREVNSELKDIIRHLQFIYRFVDDIQACFGIAYELILKATAIILPVTTFGVVEALKEGVVSLEFLMFIVGSIVITVTPCYCSDALMEKGEDIRQAIYACGWERQYDRSSRTTILILLTRALRPIAICTMFRTVCLDTLTDLFQQSYAIFSLMNAMFN
nr:olfactory receptor 33 [Antheraea pernyi]